MRNESGRAVKCGARNTHREKKRRGKTQAHT